MAEIQTIELRKSRNFGDQLNITFAFLRENFRKLGRGVLTIAGPAVALAGIVMGFVYSELYSGDPDPDRITGILPVLLIAVLVAGISGIFMFAVVIDYVRLYHDRGGAHFELNELWDEVKRDLGRIFLAMLGLFGIMLLLYVPIIIFAMMKSVALMVIYLVIFAIGIIYLAVPLSILFVVLLCEGEGLWASISRSLELVKGHWWMTAGILFVVYLIAQFTSGIFLFPAQMIGAFAQASMIDGDAGGARIVILVFSVLGSVVASFVAGLPVLASTLHYFNLVEKLEGVGLMGRIDEIGSADDEGNLNANTL